MSIVIHTAKSKISDHVFQVFNCNWGLKTMESYEPDTPKSCYRRLREVSAVGLWVGKFLECFFEIGRTWKFKDGLKTTTIAKISKLSHACNFLSSGSFWCLCCIIWVCFCWREKLCKLCCQGREIIQPASRAITCNQVLTKCLQLVFFGKPVPGVQISGTERRDVSREQRPALWLIWTGQVVLIWQSLGPSHATLPVHTRYVTSTRVAGGGKIKGHKM